MFSVYCHTNNLNGMRYVGITAQDPKARWLNGKGYHNNKKFSKAISEFGWSNLKHEILAEGLSETDAIDLEQKLIEKYDSVKNGYNNTTGGKYVSKRALCHEANLIKQGLKRSPFPWLRDWVELFENAEKAGPNSALCQNLNADCDGIVTAMRIDGHSVLYTDPMWQTWFINTLVEIAKLRGEMHENNLKGDSTCQ